MTQPILKATQLLSKHELDAVLISSEENMHYFCGFSPSEGLVLLCKDAGYHLVDSRYTVAARRYAKSSGLTVLEIENGFLALLKTLLDKHQIKTIGFEEQRVTVKTYRQWCDTFAMNWQPFSEPITALRGQKSKEELAYLVQAQRIAEKAYTELLNHVRPGKTEKELAALLDYLMLQKGSEGASFQTILVSGMNTSMPHGVPSDKILQRGDFVTMDFGATCRGYHSDMTRTVTLGSCTQEMERVYHIVLEAQLAAIDSIAPGKACKDIYQTAYHIIDKNGYGPYFKHGLGHGVGLEIHEGYSAAPSSKNIYEAGNVTSVEPGIYLPERFGVRIEDVLYLDNNGNVNLTKADKELLIL